MSVFCRIIFQFAINSHELVANVYKNASIYNRYYNLTYYNLLLAVFRVFCTILL